MCISPLFFHFVTSMSQDILLRLLMGERILNTRLVFEVVKGVTGYTMCSIKEKPIYENISQHEGEMTSLCGVGKLRTFTKVARKV